MNTTRREFMAGGMSAFAAVAFAGAVAPDMARGRRIGAVAYAFDYALGLFGANAKRPGEKWDVFRFIEETRKAGGDVAQIFHASLRGLGEDDLKRLRRLAAGLDVALEVHGGQATRKDFDVSMRQTAALGAKVIGCSFGMMMRPDKIATLDAWDGFVGQSRARLRELADLAGPLGLAVGVENHLDFGVEELRDVIRGIGSPHVGVMFDVGNTLGTLDDPSEAADLLGPLTVATHYKDFAVEETGTGFRLTMVPLGCGSLNLPEITGRLVKHIGPEVHFSIELLNGQQLEIPWLEDRFWIPFRSKPAREIAATLRHIRGKAIDRAEFKPQKEVDLLPHDAHVQLEQDRIARSVAHLKGLLLPAEQARQCLAPIENGLKGSVPFQR